MNWLDFVFIALLVVGAVMGMRFGLIRAAFLAVGTFLGWLLAGQWSDDIGGLFDKSLSNDTLVTVISYAIVIVGALIVSNFALKIVRPLLSIFTLGLSSLVDKLGGLALGLLIGVAISSALIIGLARLTYDFDVESIADIASLQAISTIPGGLVDQVKVLDDQLAKVKDAKVALEDALTGSKVVSAFIDASDALPADALGFVPSDFKAALDILEASID